MSDPFEDAFWRPQGTPEEIAQQRRERAQAIMQRSTLAPKAGPAASAAPRHPDFERMRKQVEAEYIEANLVRDAATGRLVSKTLAAQLGIAVEYAPPVPAYVEIGDPDGDADVG